MFRDSPGPGRSMWRRCWSMPRGHHLETMKSLFGGLDPRTNEDRLCGRKLRRIRRLCLSRRDGNWFRHGKTRRDKTQGTIMSTIKSCLQNVRACLTNGSGMKFVPSITSVIDHCHGESRRLWQRCYEIMVLIGDDHGATDWNTLLPLLCRDFENENSGKWSNKDCWIFFNEEVKRYQYCLNSDGLIF